MKTRLGLSAASIACTASTSTAAVAGEPATITVHPERATTLPGGLPEGQHAEAIVLDAADEPVEGALVLFTLCPPPISLLGHCIADMEAVATDASGRAPWGVPPTAMLEPGTYTLGASVDLMGATAEFRVLIS